MTDVATGGLIAGSLMVLANIVVQQATIAAAFGVLAPNAYVGIRTDATRGDEAAWRAAHRAVLVIVGAGTLLGIALGAGGLFTALAGEPTASIVLTLASAGTLAATVGWAAVRGHRVAEATP